MRRRPLLGLLGSSALAGCSQVTALLASGMPPRRITVADTDADPTAVPVAFEAEMVSKTATNDDPARLQVTVTNRGENRLQIQTGWPGVFGGTVSEQTDPGLLLIPPASAPMPNPGCLQPARTSAIPTSLLGTDLAPGASESVTVEVWGQTDNDPSVCLPLGTFTFRAKYTVPSGDDWESFTWGFSLGVDATE